MKWTHDVGLELYVAAEDYHDKRQISKSRKALGLFDEYGLRQKADIIPLIVLDEHREVFEVLKDPKSGLRLPFLIMGHACMTGAILGHSGLEEIAEALESMRLIH